MSDPGGSATPDASRWYPALGWAGVILILTSWPSPPDGIPTFPGLDKVVHVALYAVLGYLVSRALRQPVAIGTRLNAVTAMAIFAFVDELHQLLIPGRSASGWDWASDLIGATAGLFVGLHLLSLARARQDQTS